MPLIKDRQFLLLSGYVAVESTMKPGPFA